MATTSTTDLLLWMSVWGGDGHAGSIAIAPSVSVASSKDGGKEKVDAAALFSVNQSGTESAHLSRRPAGG